MRNGRVGASAQRAGAQTSPPRPARLRVVRGCGPAAGPAVLTARVQASGPEQWLVEIDGQPSNAERDPSVHPEVLAGAARRGERVLVERRRDGRLWIVGALRTQPTPGIDVAHEYAIEAKRIAISADEVTLGARAAAIVLRAVGEVETYAERIISRAEGVHKIVGRMLRLN